MGKFGDAQLKALEDYFKSPEFQDHLVDIKKADDLKFDRLSRLAVFLATLSVEQFNTLMDRLIGEHTEELKDRWYAKGIMPNLTNKMQLMFDYIFWEYSNAKKLLHNEIQFIQMETGFNDEIAEFRGYYFHRYFGQGTGHGIHKDGERVLWGW